VRSSGSRQDPVSPLLLRLWLSPPPNCSSSACASAISGISGVGSADRGPSWHAIGTGGGSDILFQNTNGQAAIWEMNGTNIAGGGEVNPNPGSSWKAITLTSPSV